MHSFKQFVAEQENTIEQGVMVNGIPTVLIERGIKQGFLDKDGVPNVLIQKPRRKALNEDATPTPKWTGVNDNAHIGSRLGHVDDHLRETDKTNDSDRPHLRKYAEDSSFLNQELFKAHRYGRTVDQHVADHDTKALDAAVGRNKLKKDLHVYSGVGFHPGHMRARHPEGHVHLAAYTSTSIDKHTAMDFAGDDEDGNKHIMHIHLKKGQKGKYMAPHGDDTDHEHEYLLPRHTTVQIHPEPTVHRSGGQEYHIWHAHVVDNK